MSQTVEFFLKMDTGVDADSTKPPFILHFALPKGEIEAVRKQADAVIKGLRGQKPFANPSHAAQFTIANSIFTNEIANPDARQILSILLVHLATDTPDKQQSLAQGAKRVGLLLAASPQALANAPESVTQSSSPDTMIKSLLNSGISPFRFRYAALMPA
jgi:hypothetical protein